MEKEDEIAAEIIVHEKEQNEQKKEQEEIEIVVKGAEG